MDAYHLRQRLEQEIQEINEAWCLEQGVQEINEAVIEMQETVARMRESMALPPPRGSCRVEGEKRGGEGQDDDDDEEEGCGGVRRGDAVRWLGRGLLWDIGFGRSWGGRWR